MKPRRVLIGGFTHHVGGMEIYVMEIYRHINREEVQFDFLDIGDEKIVFQDEINKLGGRVINIPTISANNNLRKKILNELFASGEYVSVYYQFCRRPVNYDVFKIAHSYGLKKCIIHSHGTNDDEVKGIAYKILSRINKRGVFKHIDYRFACSHEAGTWMFGKNSNYKIVRNCVDTEKFKFRLNDRKDVREQLGIPQSSMVVGTVARLAEVKNPRFLITYFAELLKKNQDVYLVHVGEGELFDSICTAVKNGNMEKRFRLLGRRTDVDRILSAMDVFLLPSFHEGFPISLVEAQCSGLSCIASTLVTTECNITGKVSFVDLCDVNGWVERSLGNIINDEDYRSTAHNIVREKGYDLTQLSNEFEEFFTCD